ncbi:hypothetical protein V5N11_026795 [Cardamine amara subsp. amara]|uniref:Integrase catalytic domain-containing protein n=1 Tax=Cardamine amara subsp. amara TaxID=228776 RepID=A0ABD1BYJ1_CARAN
MVSDRDKVFLSKFWTELFNTQGTQLLKSTAYHPETDGQTKVVNRCLETYLRCFAGSKPNSWAQWLNWAEFLYNTSYHSSLKNTSFHALYGRDPPKLLMYGDVPNNNTVGNMIQDRDSMIAELKCNLEKAQISMRNSANKHRREGVYQVGELVYLKLRPYRQAYVAQRRSEKLAPRYFGPFEITERIGKVAYRQKLPPTSLIHPVFHVSLLKKVASPDVKVQEIPSTLTHELEWKQEPDEVVGLR